MISSYAPGSDITILDTIYQYPKRKEDGSGYDDDFISILYRDNVTGKKDHHVVYKPDYEYYIIDGNIQLNHNLFFIEKDKCMAKMAPYSNLLKDIAQETGNIEFFYNNLKAGNRGANKQLHKMRNIMNSDMDINDHFRYRFDKLYKNESFPISKAYFDIEADTISMKGEFPEMGECPINAVSYIGNNKIRSFVLRNPENPLVEEFEKSINKELFKELNDFIILNIGGMEKAQKYKMDNLEYEFLFYDEEVCLLHDLFKIINTEEPDFLLAWNMAFDIPYIIERLYNLGYDPTEFLCHPSFKDNEKIVSYYIDEEHKNEYEARGDRYKISSHTVYLDQLIHFASRRKGQSAFPNFKLDTAGNIITGVKKLDYSHITTNIAELPYLDFKTFIFYNIMDTIVQKCIEEETNDIDYIFSKCLINNTRYDKGHRQTIYLANRAVKNFNKDGYVIGNNINIFNAPKAQYDENGKKIKRKKEFEGALVGDPTHNSDVSKMKLEGRAINIMDNLDDYDFKSLYPSIQREFNMAPNTQIGKIIIPDKVHKYEDPFSGEHYDRGSQYIEDLVSQNIITFSNRWLGFPTFREFLDDLEKYFSNIENPANPFWDHRKLMVPIKKNHEIPLMTSRSMAPDKEFIMDIGTNQIIKPLDYNSYLLSVKGM